ncbi:MAG: tRNA (adenosine(37)-N6)-threonylcarbamoyltransferase complex dimerization subunit type 1 TsaB [Treponema sp.]|nr:tRNA (adenosine(37)-N6)-threonylcarbamoyltransferase complex dimerization subunit type 1 TsaB [Treponema sp.]
MNILALDTATTLLSVALGTENGTFSFEIDAGQRHSELLMDVTERVIKTAGLQPGDIELVACMKGPGSFTGLRIGFAAAKGLALSLGIPMIAIPTLNCIATSYRTWPGIVLPIIDAKKHRYFTALYRRNERLSPFMDADVLTIADTIATNIRDDPLFLTGPDAHILLPELCSLVPVKRIYLDPLRRKGRGIELLTIAKNRNMAAHSQDIFSGPEYLRQSDAELSFSDRRPDKNSPQ